MSGKDNHLDALTAIRGIAAWLVVLYHIRLSLTALLPEQAIATLAKGYLAVDLFFMLSGFVIWYNYADRLRAGGRDQSRLFLWRRFARIWPLHAFILLVYILFALVLAATGRETGNFPFAELPLHFALAQNWGFTDLLTWNHPAWSISTEFAAYLVFPLVVLAVPLHRLGPGALVTLAIALVLALHLKFLAAGYQGLGEFIPRMGLWRCLIGFALGNVLCLLWLHWRQHPQTAPAAALACAALTLAGLRLDMPETLIVPVAFFIGLLALATASGWPVRALSHRALLYLGEISYSTYLGHFLLWAGWKIAFVDQSLQLGWVNLLGFLGLVLLASILLYHGVEKPAQRWLNARQPGWVSRHRAVPAG